MADLELTYTEATVPTRHLVVDTWAYQVAVSPRYAVRLRAQPHIKARMPFQTPDEPWWPQVTNGRLVVHRVEGGHKYQIVYELPEFWGQPFVTDTALGIEADDALLRVRGEPALIHGRRRLMTRRYPLHVVVDTDPASSNFGKPRNLTVRRGQETIPVADWHAPTGEIILEWDVDFTDELTVDYDYVATTVTYKGFYDGTRYYALDLNPLPGHTYDDQDGFSHATRELLGIGGDGKVKAVYLYALPASVTDIAGPSSSITNGSVLRHWVAPLEQPEDDVFAQIQARHSTQGGSYILLIAKFVVRMPYSPRHIQLIDTRRRGGGLRDDLDPKSLQSAYPTAELDQFTDIARWDGPPHPEHGVFVVRLPAPLAQADPQKAEAAEQAVATYKAAGTLGVPYLDPTLP